MAVLGEVAAPRSVSLYWLEKLWLLIDAIQLLQLLNLTATSALPFQWARNSRWLGIFLLDFTHGFSRPFLETNSWGALPLGAAGRIAVLVFFLALAVACVCLNQRAQQAVAADRRRKEQEELEKQLQLQQQKSLVKTRPSVTAMLVDAMRPGAATRGERWKQKSLAFLEKIHKGTLIFLEKAILLRVPLGLLLLPSLAVNALPFVFCSDQSEICAFSGMGIALLVVRIAAGLGVFAVFVVSVVRVSRRLRESVISLRPSQQEAFVKQQELEFLLHLTDNWREQQTWLVSSFRGGLTGAHSRLTLLALKLLLVCVFSLFGQTSAKAPTGLHWLAQQIPFHFDWAKFAAALKAESLGAAVAAEPFGRAAMAALGSGIVCLFALFFVLLPPYRCRSSNCMHVLVFLHLIGVASVTLAAAGGNSSSSILLPTNLARLLLCLHAVSAGVVALICVVGLVRSLLPQESTELLHYEALLGFRPASTSTEDAEAAKHLADQRGNWRSFLHNLKIVLRRGLRRFLRSLRLREALEHFDRSWSFLSSSAWGSWFSDDSDESLQAGELQLDESAFALPPFQAPWPILPQHARFCVRVAPELVGALAASQKLLEQMAAADKTLVPLLVVNSQFQTLSDLVAKYIGTDDIRPAASRRSSERRSVGQFLEGEEQELEDLLRDLQLRQTQAATATLKESAQQGNETDEEDDEESSSATSSSHQRRSRLPWKSRASSTNPARPQEAVAFVQQSATIKRFSETEKRSSSSSVASDASASSNPNTFDFKRLQHMAFMSKEFAPLKLNRLRHLQTVVEAFRFCVIDIFQKLSALQKAVAENSICRETHKEALKSRRLLQELSVHLNRRNRRLLLVPLKLRRILFKLLAIRYITASVNSSRRDLLLLQEKRKNQIELFGEESSVVFFAKEDDMFGDDEDLE